jgi:uncharacterized membrane protein YjdF
MATRETALGDWGPIVRDPLDVLRAAFVVAACVLAALGHVSYINLAFSTAAVVAVRFVNLPRRYELAFILSMALTGWGDALGLYDALSFYDKIVHFLVPFSIAPIVYILLARSGVVPHLERDAERHHHVGIFVVTLALGLSVGALWEIFEWLADVSVGASLQKGTGDTVTDLVADACGAAAGGALLALWSFRSWASERRRGGTRR